MEFPVIVRGRAVLRPCGKAKGLSPAEMLTTANILDVRYSTWQEGCNSMFSRAGPLAGSGWKGLDGASKIGQHLRKYNINRYLCQSTLMVSGRFELPEILCQRALPPIRREELETPKV